MIRAYYMLTKPGILLGNALTTGCGFMLASRGTGSFFLFLSALIGILFVIASACIMNNVIDRKADAKMERTKSRPLAQGIISLPNAFLLAGILLIAGQWILLAYTNVLTASIALCGFLFYVVLYSLWKYRSVYGTLVGSFAGAVPPLVGYTAVTGRLDFGAFLLFSVLVFWQMPHFYAIALYRLEDYRAAAIPVLPLKKGSYTTKIHIVVYLVLFLLTTLALTFFGYAGKVYFITILSIALLWLWLGVRGFKEENDRLWARRMFFYSLLAIMLFVLSLSFDVR